MALSGALGLALRMINTPTNNGLSVELITAIDGAVQKVNDSNTKTVGGSATFSAAASVTITTGLANVSGFSVVQETSSAPTPVTFTCVADNGDVTVYAWKPTNSSTTTLTAASGSWSVRWVATGT